MLAFHGRPQHPAFLVISFLILSLSAYAQSSGTIEGVVQDQSGAVVPGAIVEIHNPVSHYTRSTTTDKDGDFSFTNVPFNPYHLVVTSNGFQPNTQDVDVLSVVATAVTAA